MAELTLRQQNESEYYDTFSKNYDLGHEIDLSIIDHQKQGLETRDWNSYWAFFKQVVNAYSEGSRLLDFGCGAGHDAVRFAHAGYDVCGFDISEGNCNAARHFASRYELSDKINISVETAEALSYEDNFFDVVAGVDVLHHVDIPNAIRETYRVLKPGGVAFFREPVEIRYSTQSEIHDWLNIFSQIRNHLISTPTSQKTKENSTKKIFLLSSRLSLIFRLVGLMH